MPFYDRFFASMGKDQKHAIRRILERLWDGLDGPVPIDVESLIGQCIGAMLPDDEGEWTVDRAGAEDASAALAYALISGRREILGNPYGPHAALARRLASSSRINLKRRQVPVD